MSKNKGFVLTYRDDKDTDLYNIEVFDKYHAWLDLIIRANHTTHDFILGNEVVKAERGSVITSERQLAEDWKWSKKKVRNFLSLLEKEGKIIRLPDRKKTVLLIVDYDRYQGTASGTTEGQNKNNFGTVSGTTTKLDNIRDKEKQGTANGTAEEPLGNHWGTSEDTQRINDKYMNNTLVNNEEERESAVGQLYGAYKNVHLTSLQFEYLRTNYPDVYQEKIDKRSKFKKDHPNNKFNSDYENIEKMCKEDSKKSEYEKTERPKNFEQLEMLDKRAHGIL